MPFLLVAACSSDPSGLVVRGATVIDGTGAAPVENAVLVVVDGRVLCVGSVEACEVPDGVDEVDGRGFWIVPGLIDTNARHAYQSDPLGSEQGLQLGFLLGVTAVRNLSARQELGADLAAVRLSREPRRAIPRLFVASHLGPGATGAGVDGADRPMPSGVGVRDVHTPEDVESLGTVADAAGLPAFGQYWSDSPLRSLLTEAIDAGFVGLTSTLGIPLAVLGEEVLAGAPPGPETATFQVWRRSLWLEADTDSLHKIAATIAARGLWLEPALAVERRYVEPYGVPPGLHRLFELPLVSGLLRDMPDLDVSDDERSGLVEMIERVESFLVAFEEAGGMVVTGSMGVIPPGLAIHAEMAALVAAGLSTESALAAATRNAAIAIGAEDSIGTLEPGKIADFVVLEGDPLMDIANMQLVSRVSKAGVLHDPATLFDALAGDLRDRTTPPLSRLIL
ncbi:MAG: amidohydrolase family protein, partial [Gemmatimonadota bacterium]